MEYRRKGKDLKYSVAEILKKKINHKTVNLSNVNQLKKFFNKYAGINFVTTNYDTLLSEYILEGFTNVFIEKSAIPKSGLGQNIYHIHGCISKPRSLILTINDYFKFQHRDSYLSRKLYTLLQETTTVILGYSLGDFNLNRIFHEAQITKANSLRKSDMYLVSRDPVDQIYKDFYSYTYGIHVIDDTEINEFFSNLEKHTDEAKNLNSQVKDLQNVMDGKSEYTDEFIKLRTSFNSILLQASTLGISPTDEKLVKVLISILKKKKTFTYETSAWSQYEHLAEWLIDLASIINFKTSDIKPDFLKLVEYSFTNMSKDLTLGYSWAAYRIWKNRFYEIKLENQQLIEEFAQSKTHIKKKYEFIISQ